MPETKFDPDPDVVAERQPAACPHCGHDGAFDGLGSWKDEIVTVRAGVETTYEGTYHKHHCPNCNGRFSMLLEAEKKAVEAPWDRGESEVVTYTKLVLFPIILFTILGLIAAGAAEVLL